MLAAVEAMDWAERRAMPTSMRTSSSGLTTTSWADWFRKADAVPVADEVAAAEAASAGQTICQGPDISGVGWEWSARHRQRESSEPPFGV
eukprot:scaffold2247_cov112-Isochrysis_galbana.AAC.3